MENNTIINEWVSNEKESTIIKVVGVGGGGCNAVNNMFNKQIEKVAFAVCNTDDQALMLSPVETRIALGPETTSGLGAGNQPDIAKAAAEESAKEIEALFEDTTKMAFICAGMGGGTGTGAAPVVARIAHEKKMLTVGIATIPFAFEGHKKIMQALDGVINFARFCDALLVINNDKLLETYPDKDLTEAFDLVDDVLYSAASSIARIVNERGYINLDFADVSFTLRNGGVAIMNTGMGKGANRVEDAINDALTSPLLNNNDIYNAHRLLMNFYCSRQHAIKIADTAKINAFTEKMPAVDVIWGINFDDKLEDEVYVTIIATGPDMNFYPDKGLPDSVKIQICGENCDVPEKITEKEREAIIKALYGDRLSYANSCDGIDLNRFNDDEEYFLEMMKQPAIGRIL